MKIKSMKPWTSLFTEKQGSVSGISLAILHPIPYANRPFCLVRVRVGTDRLFCITKNKLSRIQSFKGTN